MLKRFLEIIDYSFEIYEDSLIVTSAELQNEQLILKINLHFDEEENGVEKYGEWEITCLGIREQTIQLGNCSYFVFFDESVDHVLTWKYTKPSCGVSFYGKTENPYEVIGKLFEAHIKLAEKWIPFQKEFNDSFNLVELISGKFGLLTRSTEPFALAYEEVMKQCGISVSHTEPENPYYWNGKEYIQKVSPLCVMIFNESYIIAEKFEAKEISREEV
jgi:hypothetical protein